MRIIHVKHYKKKTILFLAVIVLWFLMYLLSNFFIENRLALYVTTNNNLSFSYPLSYKVNNIFVNSHITSSTVKTGLPFKKPAQIEFYNYKCIYGNFSFNYPSAFTLDKKEFPGSEILYHIDFQEKSGEAHGFVQVWNLPCSLKDFLDKSKETSDLRYKYFKTSNIKVNGIPGYMWDYCVLENSNINYKGKEVFLSKDERMYRISFFIPEKNWDKKQSKVFWQMVSSFKIF